jgi:hypothetical protein
MVAEIAAGAAGAVAGGSKLAKFGKALWTAGKKVPKAGLAAAGVAGVALGAGAYGGAKVTKGIVGFFRSFFPFNSYDWFFLTALFMHVIFDGLMFGFNYTNPDLFWVHFWFACIWLMVFTLERAEGVAVLPSFLGNILILGSVWMVDAVVLPWLRGTMGNPNLILFNRILFPVWPWFAFAYAFSRRKQEGISSPFIKRMLVVGIVVVFVLFAGDLRAAMSGLPPVGGDIYSQGDQARFLEYAKNGWNKLSSSASSSYEAIKYFLTLQFIADEIEKFKPEYGTYQPGGDATIGVSVGQIRIVPPRIEPGGISTLFLNLDFKTFAERTDNKGKVTSWERLNEVIGSELNSFRVRVFGSTTVGTGKEVLVLDEEGMKCTEATLASLLRGEEIRCRPDLDTILAQNNDRDSKIRITANYDFATVATKTFFFMDESLRRYDSSKGRFEDAYPLYFNNQRPLQAQNTGGPVRIGINADGQMVSNPLWVSEDRQYLFIINVQNAGQGSINSIERIYVYAPQGMQFGDDVFTPGFLSESECIRKFFGDAKPLSGHNCLVMDVKKVQIYGDFSSSMRNNVVIALPFALTDEVLSGGVGKSDVFVRVDYNYNMTSGEVSFYRAKGLQLTE